MAPSAAGAASRDRLPALRSTVPLSLWGGVDPSTGVVIDPTHPLVGSSIGDAVLCLPGGRGSCTGSQVLLELILNGKAPRAIVTRDVDAILCVGAVVAEEFFGDDLAARGRGVPVVCAVGEEDFGRLIDRDEGTATLTVSKDGDVRIEFGDEEVRTRDLLRLDDALGPPEPDRDDDDRSPAEELASRVLRRIAAIAGARELIPVTSAHVDAVTYIGPGGLRFAERLVELGGRVKVRTTLNSQSCDRRRWKEHGIEPSRASAANAVGDAYLALGCEPSFTCAPYLLPEGPERGDQICWGESNAVVYSNSVIGARTEKYADYLDICAAIVGKVPNVGVHVAENRVPTIVIDARIALICVEKLVCFPTNASCSSGWTCGTLSDGRIPLILGFDALPMVSRDDLKAFSAAFGTTGSAPMFHMAGITPEATDCVTIKEMILSCGDRRVVVSKELLHESYETLDSGNDGSDDISLVALGNPHLSVSELKTLSDIFERDERPRHDAVKVIATLGRDVLSKGFELGYGQKLESFGVKFVNDSCWCMLMDPPIVPPDPTSKILTNSGKYAHYGPGLTNRRVRFGSIYECAEAAKSGKLIRQSGRSFLPQRLQSQPFSTQQFLRMIKNIW
ncbi:hypothetical protein ACHAWF_012486 [Thalassiosira exigua]